MMHDGSDGRKDGVDSMVSGIDSYMSLPVPSAREMYSPE